MKYVQYTNTLIICHSWSMNLLKLRGKFPTTGFHKWAKTTVLYCNTEMDLNVNLMNQLTFGLHIFKAIYYITCFIQFSLYTKLFFLTNHVSEAIMPQVALVNHKVITIHNLLQYKRAKTFTFFLAIHTEYLR